MESRKQAENQRKHMKKHQRLAGTFALFKYVNMGKNSLNWSNLKGDKMLTGKATQATISQTSIFLHVLQFLHVKTQLQWITEHSMDCHFEMLTLFLFHNS